MFIVILYLSIDLFILVICSAVITACWIKRSITIHIFIIYLTPYKEIDNVLITIAISYYIYGDKSCQKNLKMRKSKVI